MKAFCYAIIFTKAKHSGYFFFPVKECFPQCVAALPIGQGMITLFNTTLKKIANNETQTIQLKEDDTCIEEIEKYFEIKLDASYKDLKSINVCFYAVA